VTLGVALPIFSIFSWFFFFFFFFAANS